MVRCPICQAENLPDAVFCAKCRADLAADDADGVPTQRTRPRLLILRPASNESMSGTGAPTDCGIGAPPTRR